MKSKEFFKKMRIRQEPSPEFRAKLRESLVAYMNNNPSLPKPTLVKSDGMFLGRRALAISFASIMILFTGTIGTVFAAQKSLPGDALYGIKLAVDHISVAVSNSPELRISVADRRLAEVKEVLAAQPVPGGRSETDMQSALQQYQ